jgi:hypothetical protein
MSLWYTTEVEKEGRVRQKGMMEGRTGVEKFIAEQEEKKTRKI